MDDSTQRVAIDWNEISITFQNMKNYILKMKGIAFILSEMLDSTPGNTERKLSEIRKIEASKRDMMVLSRRISIFIEKKCSGKNINDDWKNCRNDIADSMERMVKEFESIHENIMDFIRNADLGEESDSFE